MRRSLRFLVPLALALAAIAYAVVPLVDELTLRWFVRDLDIRARLIATAVEEPLVELLTDQTRDRIRVQRVHAFLTRVIKDERLFALGYCDASGALRYRTELLPAEVGCPDAPAAAGAAGRLVTHARGSLHVATAPIVLDGEHLGSLLIVHDMSFIERRSADTKRYVVYLFAGIGAVVALITVVIAELSWRGWMAGTTALIRGQVLTGQAPSHARELRPIARDLAALVQDLASDRRARDEAQVRWEPEALRRILREDLKGDEVLSVSNRGRTFTSGAAIGSSPAPASSSPPWSRTCAPARARSPTAPAAQTARPLTPPTRCVSHRMRPSTAFAASGSPRRRRRGTTTGSPTRACGRSATSRTRGRPSGRRTGVTTKR
jgi:trehalose 6-phosphate synthase